MYEVLEYRKNGFKVKDSGTEEVKIITGLEMLQSKTDIGVKLPSMINEAAFTGDGFMYQLKSFNRVERHKIRKGEPYFDMFDGLCFLSKNLFNYCNYIMRQQYFEDGKIMGWMDLLKLVKGSDDFKAIDACHISQKIVKCVGACWGSYSKLIKSYWKDTSKFKGKPKYPGYLPKDGRYSLVVSAESVNTCISDNMLSFHKRLNGFKLETRCHTKDGFSKVAEVRFNHRGSYIDIEVVYEILQYVKHNLDKKNFISIDLGIDNFATITGNTINPLILNGRGIKSVNQYYNKNVAKYQSKLDEGVYTSKHIKRLTENRNNRIKDYMHKYSTYIISLCKENNIDTIIVGYNKGWKNEVNLGKKVNQKFVGIPYYTFIQFLTYKAEQNGIELLLPEESYTSGTSYLDKEYPCEENYNKSRRIYRGLFVANDGRKINADVNASAQISKKVFGNDVAVKGVELAPMIINVA